MLSEGYSILYQDAKKFDASDLVLLVKAESDSMKKLVNSVGEMGDQLKKDLSGSRRTTRACGSISIRCPRWRSANASAVGMTRAKEFAPVGRKGGREYERTVLLSFANGLNHERHLCKVMAEAETDAGSRSSCSRRERNTTRSTKRP